VQIMQIDEPIVYYVCKEDVALGSVPTERHRVFRLNTFFSPTAAVSRSTRFCEHVRLQSVLFHCRKRETGSLFHPVSRLDWNRVQ
jgi:hypothetical protein